MTALPSQSPRSLLLAYALPYLIYGGLGWVFDRDQQPLALYGARAVVVGVALVWATRSWLPLRGPRGLAGSLALGAAAGLAGTALWIGLVAPGARTDALALSESAWLARAVVATALPPLVEEPLMRGFVLPLVLLWQRARKRGATQPLADAMDQGSLAAIAPGEWSVLAIVVSSAVFAVGHTLAQWPAAFAYGLLMCSLWIARRDLVSCISAHAVTNAALAIYVRATGSWALW
jgi:membrane protease YdiL (CAAX protease family)